MGWTLLFSSVWSAGRSFDSNRCRSAGTHSLDAVWACLESGCSSLCVASRVRLCFITLGVHLSSEARDHSLDSPTSTIDSVLHWRRMIGLDPPFLWPSLFIPTRPLYTHPKQFQRGRPARPNSLLAIITYSFTILRPMDVHRLEIYLSTEFPSQIRVRSESLCFHSRVSS